MNKNYVCVHCNQEVAVSGDGDEFDCPHCEKKNIINVKSSSNAVPGWVLYVGILILINILSAAFDWGFWIY